MTTLAEFLLARIGDDERDALRAITGRAWESDVNGGWFAGLDGATTAHIFRHDPERVLAECAAKRQIVENERAARTAMGSAPIEEHLRAQDGPCTAYWRGQDWVLKVHASVYASHPDFREEWRP